MRTAKDLTVKRKVPTPVDTLRQDQLEELVSHSGGERFSSTRVITPHRPIVIRQHHPDGPTYREAVTYTFLIHSMKRPRLARMDDGRLALLATAWIRENNVETPIILYSDDEAKNWSQPREVPFHGELTNLGGPEADGLRRSDVEIQ